VGSCGPKSTPCALLPPIQAIPWPSRTWAPSSARKDTACGLSTTCAAPTSEIPRTRRPWTAWPSPLDRRHRVGPEAFPGGAGEGGTRGTARPGEELAARDCGPRTQGQGGREERRSSIRLGTVALSREAAAERSGRSPLRSACLGSTGLHINVLLAASDKTCNSAPGERQEDGGRGERPGRRRLRPLV
jgi:hypothetical protein